MKYVIYVTDLSESVYRHVDNVTKLGLKQQLERGEIVIEQQDATVLAYPDAFFDRVSAVSVIEHIPGDGDSKAMKEIGRVLKRGGIAVVTVPFTQRYGETYVEEDIYKRKYDDTPVFFERHYDDQSLQRRLIEPSGLRLKRVKYFGQRWFNFEEFWERLSRATNPARLTLDQKLDYFHGTGTLGGIWRILPVLVTVPIRLLMPVFSTCFICCVDHDHRARAKAAYLTLEKPK